MRKEEKIYRNAEVSEKALEKTFVQKVREFGLMVIKNQDPTMSGMPDRLVVMPGGKVIWVEFKSRGGRLTELQASVTRRLDRLRHMTIVIDSRQDLDIALAFIKGCVS